MIGNMLMQLSALGIVWTVLAGVSYMLVNWCFKNSVAWHTLMRVISAYMATVIVICGVGEILPASVRLPITEVIVPLSLVAALLHLLLLSLNRYMKHRKGHEVEKSKFKTFLISLYVITVALMILVIAFQSPVLMQLIALSMSYVMWSIILLLLVVELLTGTCQQGDCSDLMPR